MTEIGLLSDTHGFLDAAALPHLQACDEIWHAGDIGDIQVLRQLAALGIPLRVVFGNIDGNEVRAETRETLVWEVEQQRVLMTHIGGYPGHYPARIRQLLVSHAPDIFVCGHSHILRVMYDEAYRLLAMNPGACGRSGFHTVRTLLRFTLDKGQICELRVVDLGPRQSAVT